MRTVATAYVPDSIPAGTPFAPLFILPTPVPLGAGWDQRAHDNHAAHEDPVVGADEFVQGLFDANEFNENEFDEDNGTDDTPTGAAPADEEEQQGDDDADAADGRAPRKRRKSRAKPKRAAYAAPEGWEYYTIPKKRCTGDLGGQRGLRPIKRADDDEADDEQLADEVDEFESPLPAR